MFPSWISAYTPVRTVPRGIMRSRSGWSMFSLTFSLNFLKRFSFILTWNSLREPMTWRMLILLTMSPSSTILFRKSMSMP